jgi:hypothetical protein
MSGKEQENQTLHDRDAKTLITVMLTFQIAFLAVSMLWL